MRFFKTFSTIYYDLKALDKGQKHNIYAIMGALFCTLFSYPIIRSTTEAMFLDSFGAKNSPYGWIYSVVALSIVISLYSKWQLKWNVHKLYLFTSLFTFFFFLLCAFLTKNGYRIWAYPLFIWKEVYIVLLVHMAYAYLNTAITVDVAKVLYGPFGAITSIGGIIGGLLTSRLTYFFSVEWILIFGSVFIVLSSYFFSRTKDQFIIEVKKNVAEKTSPLESIAGVQKYVFYVALIVMLSQFCINLANFKFNLLFDAMVTDRLLKTRYLGTLYSAANGVTLFVQFLVIPFAFKLVSIKKVHQFIPVFYMIVSFVGFGLAGNILFPVAMAFVMFKGVDYSLFVASKEMLYFPLNNRQKYGAKYIIDMVIYRFSKGLISFVLIYIQGHNAINAMLGAFLISWIVLLFPLFQEQKKIN